LNAPIAWEALAEKLQTHDQVLCIVNTRKDCHDLYKLMPEGTIHLSALMCGVHRSRVIAEIKDRLKGGKPIRAISTQLVEAGVDIDFPAVYRALAGLDSIAQAAGRCNREGKLESLGDVRVFVPPKDPPGGLLRKGADKMRELITPDFDPQAPDSFSRYFSLFYASVNDTRKNWLHDNLIRDVPCIQFRTAAQDFKLIDDQAQQAVVVRYGDSEEWIKQLEAAGPRHDIMRHLQRYTVNLSRRMADAMLEDGRLTKLDCGVVVQYLPRVYRSDIGLDVFNGQLPIEDLMQ
jgi:CRISPR-associated endonuclease/helicase Cas3